jgi:hypothetical protein
MKRLLLLVLLFSSCRIQETNPEPSWKTVIVKKKYSESTVTKDIVFGTGNWHDIDYYIVDNNNKIWNTISKEDYILCEVGDTLWTKNNYSLQYTKK